MKKLYCLLFIIIISFSQNIFSQEMLYDVEYTQFENAYAVGSNGTILKSSDGGTTWNLQTSGTTSRLFGVSFIDTNNGVIVGDNGTILKTANGGNTWTSQVSGTSENLYSVCFTDINYGTAVGYENTILRTTNSGLTWSDQYVYLQQDNHGLFSVSFTDVNHGTAVGSYGSIIRTTNGGTDWNVLTSGTSEDLLSVSFTDENHGSAVGGGTILRTTNGGTSWVSQAGGVAGFWEGICFIDTNNGTIVGVNGAILKTTDGGENWLSQPRKDTKDLTSVCFSDANNGLVVGVSGVIYKTTNGGATWIAQFGLKPSLNYPLNNSTDVELNPEFSWDWNTAVDYSQFQLSEDTTFTSLYYNDSTLISNTLLLNQLPDSSLFFWHIRGKINGRFWEWSPVSSFRTIGKTPRLLEPINDSLLSPININLKWSKSAEALEYKVLIATDSLFQSIAVDKDKITDNSFTTILDYNTEYYWKAGAKNINGQVYWSPFWKFNTKQAPKHSFPLDIGNKWYYQAGSNDHQHYYGCVKEVTAILSNGFREITSKFYYRNSTTTAKEYWAYLDGKFYINSQPSIDDFRICYNDYLTNDSCGDSYLYPCWNLVQYQIFNISAAAQKYSRGLSIHGSGYREETTIFPEIGLVKNYYQGFNNFFNIPGETDSLYLIGMCKTGELLGDTVFYIPFRDTLFIPLTVGQKWIYRINDSNEKVIKQVTKILTSGFREITASYYFNDSMRVKKEYWLLENNKLYISDQPGVKSYAYYDADLGVSSCLPEGSSCLWWEPNYIYKGSEFECQYRNQRLGGNNIIVSEYYVANLLGPVKVIHGTTETLIDMVIDTDTSSPNPIIQEYSLSQNYPNPFNPSTTIRYQIPQTGIVTLKVFDLLGREVAALVNEDKPAGSYQVEFSGVNLSSGVYIYKIQAGSYNASKKLLLLK